MPIDSRRRYNNKHKRPQVAVTKCIQCNLRPQSAGRVDKLCDNCGSFADKGKRDAEEFAKNHGGGNDAA